jgi:hypothetical protein
MAMLARFALDMLVFVGLAVTIGPLLVSARPFSRPAPSPHLTDPESRFIELDGLNIHYKLVPR